MSGSVFIVLCDYLKKFDGSSERKETGQSFKTELLGEVETPEGARYIIRDFLEMRRKEGWFCKSIGDFGDVVSICLMKNSVRNEEHMWYRFRIEKKEKEEQDREE